MGHTQQSGQIGLVVLLISAVLMTVGLGVASQSIFETKSSSQETASTQTFNAAEQGIEQGLSSLNSGLIADLPTGLQGNIKTTDQNFITDTSILPGQSANVILTSATNSFTVSWKYTNSCGSAVIVTIIGDNLRRYAYKAAGCTPSDGFLGVSCTGNDCTQNVTTTGVTNPALARIKVVYGPAMISVSGSLPVQSHKVDATANNTQETRTLSVTKSLAALPSIFDYVLFSGSGSVSQ